MPDLKLLNPVNGADYRSLMTGMLHHAVAVGFVVRPPADQLSETALRLINRLSGSLLEEEFVLEWPGTTVDEPVRHLLYRFDQAVCDALLAVSNGLFDWNSPDLPDDIHLLNERGDAVLTTWCQDGVALVSMSQTELRRWRDAQPAALLELIDAPYRGPGRVVPLGAWTGDGSRWKLERHEIEPLLGALPQESRGIVADYLASGVSVIPDEADTTDEIGGLFSVSHGAQLLTDGHWIWRRDYSEYVKYYGASVPESLVKQIVADGGRQPISLTEAEWDDISDYVWTKL